MSTENRTLTDIVGPWKEPQFQSGLIERCRSAWSKPVGRLTNEELATCLRQKIAVAELLPIAKKRITEGFDDDSEFFEGELIAAAESVGEMPHPEGCVRPERSGPVNTTGAEQARGGPAAEVKPTKD